MKKVREYAPYGKNNIICRVPIHAPSKPFFAKIGYNLLYEGYRRAGVCNIFMKIILFR